MSVHNRRDALLKSVKALPAAAGTAVSTAIDLGSVLLGAAGDSVEVEIVIPATPALVEAKTITVALHDSADNSSFSAITGLDDIVVTGGTGGAGAAATRIVRLPSSTRRYIATSAVVQTGGGDNTGVSTTLSVLA